MQEIIDQSAGAEFLPSTPTLMLPMRKPDNVLATGLEARIVPLETAENSTGAVMSAFFYLNGTGELTGAPDTDIVRSQMRGMLSSLRRAVTHKKIAEWKAAWEADSWPERDQEVLWPVYVPVAAEGDNEGQ